MGAKGHQSPGNVLSPARGSPQPPHAAPTSHPQPPYLVPLSRAFPARSHLAAPQPPRGRVTTSPSTGLCHSTGGGSDPLPYKPACAPAHRSTPAAGTRGLAAPSAAPARCISGTGRCSLGRCLLSRSEAAEDDGCGAVGLLCALGVLPVGKAAPRPTSMRGESQRHVGWRSPSISSGPAITLTHRIPPLKHIPWCHVHPSPKYTQGWGLPFQCFGHSPHRDFLPDSQSQPPLVQPES